MHVWGDKDFDWAGLDASIHIIHSTCKRYGRLGGYIKEKWGCIDFYVQFWDGTLHSLMYPGYAFIRFPKWFYYPIDYKIISRASFYIGLYWAVNKWQRIIYNWAHQRAIKKYPHLKDEILCNALCPEYIKGGQAVHDKYWIKCEEKIDD